MKPITGLGVIENAGPNHLRGFLKQEVKRATGVDIAVAFVTEAGLAELLPALKRASMNGPVRLLTGLYQCFTEPEALRVLLAEQHDTHKMLSVHLSTNPHFHWKAYFLFHRQRTTVVIGSSNLTTAGLTGSGELNAVFPIKRNTRAFQSLHKPFEEEWKQGRELQANQIAMYAKSRPKNVRIYQPSVSLTKILGKRIKDGKTEETGCQYWRDYFDGSVEDETAKIIDDTTNWEERGYDWYASKEPDHRKGDYLILFDFIEHWVRLVEVVETTRTPKPTPDGRQFTAYRYVRGSHRRKWGNPLWQKIKASGTIARKGDTHRGRKLTPAVFERLQQAIGFKR